MESVFSLENLWAAAITAHMKTLKSGNQNDQRSDTNLIRRWNTKNDNEIARDILTEYSVRGIPRGWEDKAREEVLNLNKEGDLLLQAEAVGKIAEELYEFGGRRNHYSGASKLAWFQLQSNWTMFDALAYEGLLFHRKRKPTKVDWSKPESVRFYKFYAILHRLEFVQFCDSIRSICLPLGVNVSPERIIDKALMTLGQPDNYCQLFRASRCDENIRETANCVAKRTERHKLSRYLRKVWRLA